MYLLNELDATLNVLALDDKTGKLEEQQTVSLLPYFVKPDRRGHCGSADVHVHPNGKFLYASNRCAQTAHVCACLRMWAYGRRRRGAARPTAAPRRRRPRRRRGGLTRRAGACAARRGVTRLVRARCHNAHAARATAPATAARLRRCARRTNHSLAIFAIAPETGHLSLLKHVECGGRTPRQFQISPSGDFLVVANQASSDLATFCIDQATGMLSAPTITPVPDSPRCVCIIEEPAAKKAPLSD